MDAKKVVSELSSKYPGKKIIQNPEEIICEVEPTDDHPEYSLAIAVIDKCVPHFHRMTTETYKLIRGSLTLYIGEKVVQLNEGDSYLIQPNTKHWAEAEEAWIECVSRPGWTIEDHIVI